MLEARTVPSTLSAKREKVLQAEASKIERAAHALRTGRAPSMNSLCPANEPLRMVKVLLMKMTNGK